MLQKKGLNKRNEFKPYDLISRFRERKLCKTDLNKTQSEISMTCPVTVQDDRKL
jgi:hypothetical protein